MTQPTMKSTAFSGRYSSAAIGGFNTGGAGAAGRYWSSAEAGHGFARMQRFEDGYELVDAKQAEAAVRLVCDALEP